MDFEVKSTVDVRNEKDELIFRETIQPLQQFNLILNNLDKVGRSDWDNLSNEYKKIKDHHLLSSVENLVKAVDDYLFTTGEFPTIATLQLKFKDIRAIYVRNDKYDKQIYDDFLRYVKQEVFAQSFTETLKKIDSYDHSVVPFELWKEIQEKVKTFADTSKQVAERSWDDLISAGYNEQEEGLKTGIDRLDEVIDSLDAKSLCTVAFPSGHGKTLTALNVTYNLIKEGKKVTYISYELPSERILNCLISISSFGKDKKLINSKISKHLLTDEEKSYRIELAKALPLDNLTILDNTDLSGIKTFPELLELLENRGKETPQDLIIIDNLDAFVRYSKSKNNSRDEVNSCIAQLEPFSQTYCDNQGCVVLGLAQCNREGIKKLDLAFSSNKAVNIDYTVISEYSETYTKARTVIVGYCGSEYRACGKLAFTLVKSTYKAVTGETVEVAVDFDTLAVNNKAKFSSMPAISEKDSMELDKLGMDLIEE